MARLVRALAAGGLVAGWFAVAGTGGAEAAATISVSSPQGSQAYQSQPAIRGSVTPDATEHLSRNIQIEVKETDQPGLVDQTTTVTGTAGATSAAAFAWQPSLAYNGNYQAIVTAWQANPVGIEDGPYNATQSFVLQAPPAKPDAPAVAVGSDGASASVGWRPNGEPDLLGYQVLRTPGYTGGKVPTIPKTDARCSPSACGYADSDVTPGTGYQYQIAAVRSAGPGTTSGVTSTSNLSPKVVVPLPASSSTSAGATGGASTGPAAAQGGGQGAAAGAAAPLAPALARTGKVDLSGFASLLDRSRATGARPGPEADTGFQTALPYAPAQPEVGQGGSPVRRAPQLGAADRPAPVRPWAFFALGLLVSAVAVHLLWLRGEVRNEPVLEVLPVPASPAVPAMPATQAMPAARPAHAALAIPAAHSARAVLVQPVPVMTAGAAPQAGEWAPTATSGAAVATPGPPVKLRRLAG